MSQKCEHSDKGYCLQQGVFCDGCKRLSAPRPQLLAQNPQLVKPVKRPDIAPVKLLNSEFLKRLGCLKGRARKDRVGPICRARTDQTKENET